MSNQKKLYVDNVAPSIPEWYAEYKYDPDKSVRESYIDNALNPYSKAYSFYNMRDSLRKQQLLEAKEIFKRHQQRMKEKQNVRSVSNWRNKINFVL